ncbi:MAG TPA: FkbM family methyltransferase [Candidatus Krumholzibacteria bacterium]|nr:FkbM family methyltransferase [Candidatus Krumholzibacteria bacterium]
MSVQVRMPSLIDRTYLRVAGSSWRIRQHTSRIVRLHGPSASLKVPIINGVGYGNIEVEREVLYPLLAWLTHCRKGTFIDVGANIGQTLLVTLVAGQLHRYIGFEPSSCCCAYLHRLLELNGLRHCQILPVGLSDRVRIAELHYNVDYDVCASTTPGFRPKAFFQSREHVVLMPGDEVLRRCELDEIGMIKIDVEGGELEVVRGLRETIARHKPILLLEVLPYLHLETDARVFPEITTAERQDIVAERKRRTEALEAFVRDLGYGLYRIEENGDLTPTPWMRAEGPEQRTEMNFLALHDCEKAEFEAGASGRLRRPAGSPVLQHSQPA